MGLKAIAIIVVSLAISGLFIDTTDARRLESYRPPPPGPPQEGGSWVWVSHGSKDDDDDWSDDGHSDDDWSDDGHDDDTDDWEGDDHVETTDDWEGDDHKEDDEVEWSGKSEFVLIYDMNLCVQIESRRLDCFV